MMLLLEKYTSRIQWDMSGRRRLWGFMLPIRGDCMTCVGMYRSGVRIGWGFIQPEVLVTLWDLELAITACCEVAVGTATAGIVAPRVASRSCHTAMVPALGSVRCSPQVCRNGTAAVSKAA